MVVTDFTVYPGYEGDLDSVSGRVTLNFAEDDVILTYALENIDEQCANLCEDRVNDLPVETFGMAETCEQYEIFPGCSEG